MLGERVIRRLTAWLGGSAFRRTVAAVCALAFLVLSFAHALHHVDGIGSQAGYELSSVTGLDDSPDGAKKPDGSIEHCHGCGMMALVSGTVALDRPERADCTTRIVSLRSNPPALENPPPIAAI